MEAMSKMSIKNLARSTKRYIRSIAKIFKEKKLLPYQRFTDSKNILRDKVALITGRSGEIGMAIARKFVDCGCNVIIAGINEEKLKRYCGNFYEKNKINILS